jgi:ABC-2 type transport system permease protein
MNTVKAIFTKQLNDFPKNISITLLYFLYPIMAFVMGNLLGDADVYAAMFAAMFVGATPMIAICNTVAEDNEYKSLRFLVMAGVRPSQYLLGLAGFVFIMSFVPLAAFALIGGFSGELLVKFIIVSVLGLAASSILGAAIGIFAKNVQQATAIYTPAMLVLAFAPIFAGANETLARIAELLFSYQVLMVVLDPYADLTRALIVISVNIVVLLTFFIFAYKKKGLRG